MNRQETALATLAAIAIGAFLEMILRDRIEYRRWAVEWSRAMNERSESLEHRRAVMLAEEGISDG